MKTKTLALLAITLCINLTVHAGKKKSSRAKTQTESLKDSKSFPHIEPKTEFEHLAVILTKYGHNPDGLPALHYAILQEDIEAVDLLLKYCASPLTKDSPSANWHSSLYYAIKVGSVPLVKKLIDLGEDITSFDGNHSNIIYCALQDFRQVEVAKFMLTYIEIPTYQLEWLRKMVVSLKFTPEQTQDILQLMAH